MPRTPRWRRRPGLSRCRLRSPDRGPDRYHRGNDLHLRVNHHGPKRGRHRSDRSRRRHRPLPTWRAPSTRPPREDRQQARPTARAPSPTPRSRPRVPRPPRSTCKQLILGQLGNSDATSTNWTAGSFGGADLSGGVNAQSATGTLTVPASAPHRGPDRYRRGNDLHLRDRHHAQSAADTVLIGADVQSTLANLVAAINATPAQAGTTYASATVANTAVTATASTATTLTLASNCHGGSGQQFRRHLDQLDRGFIRGRRPGRRRERCVGDRDFHRAAFPPDRGPDRYRRWNDLHLASTITDASAANTVLIGPDVTIDPGQPGGRHQRGDHGGQGAGTTYGTGTVANTSVTATGPTATTLTLQAISKWVSGQ